MASNSRSRRYMSDLPATNQPSLPVTTGRSSSTSAVLPTPGAPLIKTARHSPANVPSKAARSDATSLSRPTSRDGGSSRPGRRSGIIEPLQVGDQAVGCLVAVIRLLLQQMQDDRRQRRGHGGIQLM